MLAALAESDINVAFEVHLRVKTSLIASYVPPFFIKFYNQVLLAIVSFLFLSAISTSFFVHPATGQLTS